MAWYLYPTCMAMPVAGRTGRGYDIVTVSALTVVCTLSRLSSVLHCKSEAGSANTPHINGLNTVQENTVADVRRGIHSSLSTVDWCTVRCTSHT